PTGTSRTSGPLSLTAVLQTWGSRAVPAWVPHLVHRLDRETSGALLVAKAAHIHARLDRLLREGAIRRTYAALVEGDGADIPARIDIPVAPDPHRPGRYRLSGPDEPGSKPAITLVKRCIPFPGDPTAPERVSPPDARLQMSYLELTLLTGRTHQIRVHLSGLGHPVLGDRWYGTRYPGMPLMLHARSLSFPHPLDGRTITVSAPLPETWKQRLPISDLLNRKT
ncbi:MAG: RluA family pseudouridine synthase, partial [Alicyclobacillaceae bacterium]|nr:RluA family pseudouridine synthase [Alicyclobacillaceae bacterium]